MASHEHARGPTSGAQDGQDHGAREDGVGRPEDGRARAVPMVDARLDSRDLFDGRRVVTIAHGEHVYQLRLTSQNKLILTK